MRHHAIVVTTWSADKLAEAHAFASQSGMAVSPCVVSPVNGYGSFFVAPDGSKEGWDESDKGDAQRDAFVRWLRGQAYEDMSSPFSWVEVQYGDDDGVPRVVRADGHDEDDQEGEGG